ncbi:MAG TPA: GNAT family N-acetyltransferase [Steroidobacteraceae bacterium]
MSGSIRPYRTGDEGPIVELSNRSLAPYAGWMRRTVEYWQWSILRRPGVSPADVLVLESDDRVVGYAALLGNGKVLDFSVAADQRRGKRRAFAKKLIHALEDNARARGCDLLTFSLPASDEVVDTALRDAGYVVEQSQYFSLGILDPRLLLLQLLSARRPQLPASGPGVFTLELTPGDYAVLQASRLLIRVDPDVSVEDISQAFEYPSECVIRLDLCALTDLIFCRTPASTLLRESRLDIRPAESGEVACKLLDALIIETPWHVPYCDGF